MDQKTYYSRNALFLTNWRMYLKTLSFYGRSSGRHWITYDPAVAQVSLPRSSVVFTIGVVLFPDFISRPLLFSSNSWGSPCRPGGKPCHFGKCVEGRCACEPGWDGDGCHLCRGRGRLEGESGVIIDGHGNYTDYTTCTWLIKGPEMTRLEIEK